MNQFTANVGLKPYTTLKAGGSAELFARARTREALATIAEYAQRSELPLTILGWGSNVLPSDDGVPGAVTVNESNSLTVLPESVIEADCGCGFQELFLKSAQAGLSGLEFAVGIPGTLGGALVSNAGAYRSNISDLLTELEVVFQGERQWVKPTFMEFSYRDSLLRRDCRVPCVLLRVRMKLRPDDPHRIYSEARDFQRQRISKQPPSASAGSFFKNVYDQSLADSLEGLPARLRDAGVVPAGYLIERAGLMGTRIGGAMFARRHANFIVNVGDASASEIRKLARLGQRAVWERWGVRLEEEVLYLGDWSRFEVHHL